MSVFVGPKLNRYQWFHIAQLSPFSRHGPLFVVDTFIRIYLVILRQWPSLLTGAAVCFSWVQPSSSQAPNAHLLDGTKPREGVSVHFLRLLLQRSTCAASWNTTVPTSASTRLARTPAGASKGTFSTRTRRLAEVRPLGGCVSIACSLARCVLFTHSSTSSRQEAACVFSGSSPHPTVTGPKPSAEQAARQRVKGWNILSQNSLSRLCCLLVEAGQVSFRPGFISRALRSGFSVLSSSQSMDLRCD